MSPSVTLSTSPTCKPTHWAQTLLLFSQPVEVPPAAGGTLAGHLTMARDPCNPREFRFHVRLGLAGGEGSSGTAAQRAALLSQDFHMR